jgi:predicted permease
LRGRDFAATDGDGTPKVAIINEAMAQQLWPGEDPIGKRLYNGEIGSTEPMEVIGLVRNIKDKSLGQETEPFIYAPLSQLYIPRQSLVIRTSQAGSVLPAVRQMIQNLNPNLPIISVQSMDEVAAFGLLPQRLALWVTGTMGVIGLLLTSLGIYGVTAYNVGRRTREIGIRVALGARPAAVLKLVLREGLALTAFGLAIGCAAAFALMRLIQGLLFGIAATDAVTFVATSAVFVIVALVACYIPARRAVRVDPMAALRHE